MIEYQTYPMHEKIQKKKILLLHKDFNLPYLKDTRLSHNIFSTETIELKSGSYLLLKPFKYSIDSPIYTYIVAYYMDEIRIDVNCESVISLDFIHINSGIFEEVTESFIRNEKLKKLGI